MPYTFCEHRLQLSPATFVQTSHEGKETLAQLVLGMFPKRVSLFIDLYGGFGMFALLTARRWKRAVVVEENSIAIDDLRRHIEKEDVKGLTPVCQRVERWLTKNSELHPEVVLLDPPRHGTKEGVIAAIRKMNPRTVIYVACGVDSLQADAKSLVAHGYHLDRVTAVDMFPHTSHLEVVCRFNLGAG